MDFFRSKRSGHHPIDDEQPPSKRISTPAGQRLSIVLESTQSKRIKTEPASKINVTTTSTYCNDPGHQHINPVQPGPETPRKAGFLSVLTGGRLGDTPRESLEDHRSNASNLSVSVWSDPHTPNQEKFVQNRPEARRGGWSWKRIVLIVALVVVIIIALAVGLAIGMKKRAVARYHLDRFDRLSNR
jgi:hypothetical protein